MKKLVLIAGVALTAAGVFAQGTIGFGNDGTTLVSTNNGSASGIAVGGTSPRVVLYYSSAATPPPINTANLADLTGWSLASPTTAVSVGVPVGGRFANATRTADNVSPGGQVWLMVRGWTGGFADWGAALAAAGGNPNVLLGTTTVAWQQATGNPTSTPAGTPVNMTLGANGFNGLVLQPVGVVPEPSTFVLAGLGAASLLLFRRRK
jgi:hypothetical protein